MAIPTACIAFIRINLTTLVPAATNGLINLHMPHSLLSVHNSNYNLRNLRNLDNTAQPSAAPSVFLIPKTCLYNFDPHKPHFYMVKLGFTRVYLILLISAQNIDCGYSLEPPRQVDEAVLTSTHNLCSEQKHEKYQNFLSDFFSSFFGGKIFNIFE